MSSEVISSTLGGFTALEVQVECSLSKSLPAITLVGLGNKAIDEAKERVRSAITSSGLQVPRKKIVVNLAPADMVKQGSCLDLAIALVILLASKQVPAKSLDNTVVIGELALDGQIRGVSGILGHIHRAKQSGRRIIVPVANRAQAELVDGVEIVPAASLRQVYDYLCGETTIAPVTPSAPPNCSSKSSLTFADIRGQEAAKRAMLIAIAGKHNILLNGPPGTGKTMLARAAVDLMPPLSSDEVHTLTHLYSLTLSLQSVVSCRPFRAPHHTASQISLIGGGRIPRPGEASLAHGGILFLDELLEFPRHSLESLRQPLEDKQAVVVRTEANAVFPADFMLIGALNPCPCGYLGDGRKPCTCSTQSIYQYQRKLSGPLQDRFDLNITVPRLVHSDQTESKPAPLGEIKAQVLRSWQNQVKRNDGRLNGELSLGELEAGVLSNPELKQFYKKAADDLALSGRGYVRTLRVARTIADLDGEAEVSKSHLLESLSYRKKSFV